LPERHGPKHLRHFPLRDVLIAQRLKSFQYAFAGWWHVLRTQPNAWIHAFVTVVVILLGIWLRLPARDWAVLVLTFMAVWMAEFMNTAIEAVVDLVSPDYHPLAKVAKDVAAAAVLVGAIGAVLIGLLILGPPLLAEVCKYASVQVCK
jgi:diacylglycerol kinase